MPENCFARSPLRVLSEEAVQRIHDSAVSLLTKTGVRIDSDEALTLLDQYGVRCDRRESRAYPGSEAIRRALDSVRRSYILYSRGPNRARRLDVNLSTTHTICGGAALKLHCRGQYSNATREDLVDMITLHENLDHIHVLINVVEPPEMSTGHLYPEMAALLFCYSSKPLLLQAGGKTDLQKLIRMASVVAGGREALRQRPLFMTGSNADPPLWISQPAAEVVTLGAQEGVPVSMGAYGMAGLTSPLDVAATIVQTTAMVLAGLVLTQAAQPGSAYDFACHSAWCDLRTGDVITMSPRVMQAMAGLIQMGRHYNLVTHALSATEAKVPDAQAAGERFFSMASSVMCGASLIEGSTSEMSGMELADFGQCVLDNEIAGYVLDFAIGVGMEGLDEALEAVEDVVTCAEYSSLKFLGHPHTARRCRELAYEPDLFSVGLLSRWLGQRPPALYERAEQKAADLIAQRQEFVTPEFKDALFRIAAE